MKDKLPFRFRLANFILGDKRLRLNLACINMFINTIRECIDAENYNFAIRNCEKILRRTNEIFYGDKK